MRGAFTCVKNRPSLRKAASVTPKEETDEGILLTWYENVPTRRVDLVGDYAGNELFFIEGDSLLLQCFSTSKVDLDDGFQMLHAIHAVENFLYGLLRRKCNFHVVFFDNHEDLCVQREGPASSRLKYLLTREILVRHLQLHLGQQHPRHQVRVFSSFQSEDFTHYLTTTSMYFLMCHDGASTSALSTMERFNQISDDHHPKEGDSAIKLESKVGFRGQGDNRIGFRYMIYEFIRQGYNVALLNGLEWKDSKVITTVVEGFGQSHAHLSVDFPTYQGRQEDPKFSIDMEKLEQLEMLQDMTERDILTVLTLSELLKQDHTGYRLGQASAFILHTAILRLYPLSVRRFDRKPFRQESEEFLLQFSEKARHILQIRSYKQLVGTHATRYDLMDLLDGRIFYAAAHAVEQGFKVSTTDGLLWSEYQRLTAIIGKFHNIDLPISTSQNPLQSTFPILKSSGHAAEALPSSRHSSVMPFRNPIFDHHLAAIKLTIDDNLLKNSHSNSAKTFKEISHWHNSKRRLGHKTPLPKLGFFALRRNQRYMAEMMAYAASLTNAIGKSLEPEVIVQSAAKDHNKDDRKKFNGKDGKDFAKGNPLQLAPKNKKGGPNSGRAAAYAAAAALKASKTEVKGTQSLAVWRLRCKELDEESDPLIRYSTAQKIWHSLGKLEMDVVGTEVELYSVGVLTLIWMRYCKERKRDLGLGVAALVWDHIVRLTEMAGLTKSIVSKIELTVKVLRLPKITISKPPSSDRPLSFRFALDYIGLDGLAIAMDPTEFQLLHCGPYFDRSMDSGPDGRVTFEPDGWQRKVLDAIDARKSLFVVAPTSSGKTFISFYAMKQILHSNDDDVLVYVAPTKALVTQIAAEIQARFSKSFTKPGRSVWAIHTRDYRINSPTGCQVLVTVPHILQIMLLAPSNAEKRNSWSCRVKRIIFDEVHCIGQAEDGIVWEQLLLLAPCPIIALSATVGNPEEFNRWLESTQASIGSDLVTVTHLHRYSDLRKFIYFPPKKVLFKGLEARTQLFLPGLDATTGDNRSFAFIHPTASLINTSRGMPDDLNLEARDCYTLWQRMSEHQTKDFMLDESLNPSKALPEIIHKSDVIVWEAELKKVLKRWMADRNSPFEAVRKDLQATVDAAEREEIYEVGNVSVDDYKEAQAVDQRDLCSTTLPMLSELHSRDALPAILFNYDRTMCEKICISLFEQLKAADALWKASSPKWVRKIAEYEKWQKERRISAAKKISVKTDSKSKRTKDDNDNFSKADLEQEIASIESSVWASFNPDAPTEGFHFADYKKLSTLELEEYVKQLLQRGQPEWLVEALKRGIGVHHAGMNRKYRQTVEMLFRKGFLRVVIATGTLALGINMPCKTVVFSGDSVFLTALNFRQAAGRAGRRGFDLLGNVIFQDIPQDKVYRLLSSRLPDLNGHFPISTTLVLRLFTLLHETKNSEYAVKAINSLLSQPRLYLGGAESKLTVLHHVRFSIEYLRRQFLLDTDGTPLNFAGCVSHLYFTENSSFAFHALLKAGYFHELCADIDSNRERVLRTMMLVLAHTFGRFPCRDADKERIERLVKRSPSLVFLPALPDDAEKVLRKHNEETLDIFKTYVQTYVEQHIREQDCRLPLTGINCGGDGPMMANGPLTPLPATSLRSPFAALSGYNDTFESIADLCRNVRSGVFLEESVIPHIAISPSETGQPLNAYLYDFFRHGDISALQKANGIRRGDIWFWLNDFSLVLATIITSLTNFVKPGQNGDMDMIDIQGSGDSYEKAQADAGREDSEESENSAEDDGSAAPAWEGRGVHSLLKVLKAFHMLKCEFDTKFKAMWA
ncbi:hypothetical protein GJ744_010390 [Endocarpon pusillum]|uniref:Helicase n=1 Tax=Endocarpon pusillum TaxID=364733 RepID=A0A8H7E1U7_9EURO|nr:hypothetical protein GJ744_010390 [Endocarpon pusillum]